VNEPGDKGAHLRPLQVQGPLEPLYTGPRLMQVQQRVDEEGVVVNKASRCGGALSEAALQRPSVQVVQLLLDESRGVHGRGQVLRGLHKV
jgi:hypothetical protein